MPLELNENRPVSDAASWTGIEEYMESAEFREAMTKVYPEDAEAWTDPVSRRNFITIMGASLALAGAAGCSPRPAPTRKILPYTRQPEEVTLGVPLFFASACPVAGYVSGVTVRSNEGRPTKIEGNPDHPSSLGGTGVFEQASILDLYDPDRSKFCTQSGTPLPYDDVLTALRKELKKHEGSQGEKLRILSGAVTSPSIELGMKELLTRFPKAKWCQFEPCGQDLVREGAKKAFGREVNAVYDFTKADVVVSLDSDFLGMGPGHLRYARDFASRRRIRDKVPAGQEHEYVGSAERGKVKAMNRLYVVECMPSITGSVADHRLPLPSSQVDLFARSLAAKLGVAIGSTTGLPKEALDWLEPLANDLKTRKGKCIVLAGPTQPAHVHAIAHAINEKLGNIGSTVHLTDPVEVRPSGRVIGFPELVKEMEAKAVDAVLILGGTNPAYTTPIDVDFAGAFKNVKFRFHLGSHQDETAALCEWHVNEAHYLEAWGDGRGHDGTVGLQQPLIAPLYDGKSLVQLLADVSTNPVGRDGLEIVEATWKKWFAEKKIAGEFEMIWQEWVRSGVVKDSAAPSAKVKLDGNWSAGMPAAAKLPSPGEYEINFRADEGLFDGRNANNGWLQELPKPVTKISWDNAAYVGLETGKKLHIDKDARWTAGERGRMEVAVVEVEYKGHKIKLPVWSLPGHPENSVTVHLGYGRERAGRVGNPEGDQTTSGRTTILAIPDIENTNTEGKLVHGSNAYVLRTAASPWFDQGAKLTPTRKRVFIGCIQAYWSMLQRDPLNGHITDRKPVRRQTIAEYEKNPWYAKIAPGSPGESDALSHNVPGPAGQSKKESGTQGQQSLGYGPGHDHSHEESHGNGEHAEGGKKHAGHDSRLMPLTMYQPNDHLYPGARTTDQRRWGMAIDLSACTGCSACLVACQSENNIPVVGKREITRAHDMYWIRIDRYYEGTQEEPKSTGTYFQPVPCQQCEKAPCEVVCPVGATTHTGDGLNDMAYNRCVGTRYCSNNCPYRVRRFNFITFQDWTTESIKLGRNPDVTVRSRGVMEKCTYCVQRIRYAEVVAEREHRPIKDGEIRTACQTACPSGAIVFGDLNDPSSVVGQWKTEPANYGLLAELNTMPRTSYLATIRNPNPEMTK